MKKIFFGLFFILVTQTAMGQFTGTRYVPSGSTDVCPGVTYTYTAKASGTILLDDGCSGWTPYDYTWDVTGGTIISDLGSKVTIEWTHDAISKYITLTTTYEGSNCVVGSQYIDNQEGLQVNLKIPASLPSDPAALSLSNNSLCPNSSPQETITLTSSTPSSGEENVWQYKINSGSFQTITTNTSSSADYTVNTGNPGDVFTFQVYSRYSLCTDIRSTSQSTNTATVKPAAPTISLTTTGQICTTAGRITINSVSTSSSQVKIAVFKDGLPATDATTSVMLSDLVYNTSTLNAGATYYNLGSGSYQLQIENYPGGCFTNSEPFTISVQQAVNSLTVIPTPTKPTCFNGSNGSISSSVTGATGSLSFSLDNSSFPYGSLISNLSPNSYTVYAKDTNGCTGSASTTVPNQTEISTPSASITSGSLPNHNGSAISCIGANDGQITVSAPSGGSGSFEYSINNGGSYQLGNVFSDLSPGDYTIRVRDTNDVNCSKQGSTLTISNPQPISPGVPVITHPTCSGSSTGSILMSTASGGTSPYTYSIPGYSTTSVGTAITGVASGSYAVTVTDVNGCIASGGTIVVNQPVSGSYSTTQESCTAKNDGTITVVSPSGGTGTYQYSLNYGSYTTFSGTFLFTGLPTGSSYSIKVKDGNGCEFTINNISVTTRPVLSPSITQTASVLCNGQSTAALDLTTGSEWTTPYSYQWYKNNVAISGPTGIAEDLSNIGTGNYKVTITDSKSCSITTSEKSVSEPSAITGALDPSDYGSYNISCKGGSNGSIDLTPGGGTPGTPAYTFLWYENDISIGITTEDLSNQQAGNYKVRITDGNGCTFTTPNIELIEPTNPVSVSLTSKTDITCYGANNGSIVLSGSGGAGGIQYQLDAVGVTNDRAYQTSNSFITLPPDIYTATAKDVNGCTQAISSIQVTSPSAALSISNITKVNPKCVGSSDGSFTVTASGGTSPYEFKANSSSYFATTIPNLVATDYVITAKDANGCEVISSTQTLTNPPALLFNSVNTTPQSCSAVVDGSISVSVSGGTGALQYSINGTTFQVSAIFNGLSAGDYTISVKDANGCTKTTPATVGMAPVVSGNITQTAFINCFGQSTAELSAVGTGGTGPYTFVWSTGATTATINGLPANDYTVTVADSKGCSGSKNATVNQPSALSVTMTKSSFSGFGVSCEGATDGFINVTVTGGTSPYSYNWSTGATIKDISTLAFGNYDLTVTDAKGCIVNGSETLTSPTPVSVSVSSKTDVTCNGGNNGAIVLSANGGAGSYEYTINGGSSWQLSSTFSSLISGNYTLDAKDQNGCTNQTNVSIDQPAAITVNSINIQNTTCGQANGSAEAAAIGGGGSYAFTWRNSSNQVVGSSAILNGVPSGSYSVNVTDQVSCTGNATAIINPSDGAQFQINAITPTTCSDVANGGAQVQITSGQGPFTVTWNGSNTGLSVTNLPAGNNSVSVTDGNSCTATQSFNVPSPAPVTLSSQVITPPTCPGGNTASIQIQAAGGSGTYSYSWNNVAGTNLLQNVAPATYALRVTDSNNCQLNQDITINDLTPITIDIVSQSAPTCSNASDGIITVQAQGGNGSFNYSWDGGSTNPQITGLQSGDYIVTATDSKGCVGSRTITLEANTQVSVSVNSFQNPLCYGQSNGSITMLGAGGAGGYDFSINGGNTWQSSTSFSGLSSQSYTIQIKDQNGCGASTTFLLNQPDPIAVTINNIQHTTCGQSNGSASNLVTGGTSPYTYMWTNASNQNVGNTADLSNVAGGTYSINVTDQNSCAVSGTAIINNSVSSDIQVNSITSASCENSADGSATVQVVSGQAPHTALWSNNETGLTAMKLLAGTNTVTVIDGNNCITTKSFTVPTGAPITLSTEIITKPFCPKGNNGSIQVLASGGASGFIYSWNGTNGTNVLANISAGIYNLLVTDSKGCTLSKQITVSDVPDLSISASQQTMPTCFSGNDGSLVVMASGGNGSFTYQWSHGVSGTTLTNLSAGTYSVTATDLNGCTVVNQFTVANPAAWNIDIGPNQTICPQQSFSTKAEIINAVSFEWSGPNGFSTSDQQITTAVPGLYTLRVTDNKGCKAEDSFQLSVSDQLLKADLLMVSEAYAKDTIIVIDISWPVPESISWNFGDKATIIYSGQDYALISYSEAGLYSVAVDASLGGCKTSYTQSIKILKEKEASGGRESQHGHAIITEYTVHPNPFRNEFEINALLDKSAPLKVQLVNMVTNKTVFEDKLKENEHHQKKYTLNNLVSGVYILLLKTGDDVKSIRLLRL